MRGSTGLCVLQSIYKLPTVVASESTVSTLVRAYTGVARFHREKSCIHGRNKVLGNHCSGTPMTEKKIGVDYGSNKIWPVSFESSRLANGRPARVAFPGSRAARRSFAADRQFTNNQHDHRRRGLGSRN